MEWVLTFVVQTELPFRGPPAATSFRATMKGRTGGLESEGARRGLVLPSLTGERCRLLT
jgi:hypothetical protein